MGKHKPTFDPSTDCGDYVVATDCSDVFVTGKKMQKKKYYSHTTRPGSLKEINMEGMVRKWGGAEVLKRAVRGMLPKNRLRDVRLDRLKCFEGAAHPFGANLVKIGGKRVRYLAGASTPVAQAQIQGSVGAEVVGSKEGQSAREVMEKSV